MYINNKTELYIQVIACVNHNKPVKVGNAYGTVHTGNKLTISTDNSDILTVGTVMTPNTTMVAVNKP